MQRRDDQLAEASDAPRARDLAIGGRGGEDELRRCCMGMMPRSGSGVAGVQSVRRVLAVSGVLEGPSVAVSGGGSDVDQAVAMVSPGGVHGQENCHRNSLRETVVKTVDIVPLGGRGRVVFGAPRLHLLDQERPHHIGDEQISSFVREVDQIVRVLPIARGGAVLTGRLKEVPGNGGKSGVRPTPNGQAKYSGIVDHACT